MKLPPFFKQTNNNIVNIVVSLSLIVAFIFNFIKTSYNYTHDYINTFAYTEFLINFQGGFVRRGLLGEILYQIYTIFPYSLWLVITVLSYAAFVFVLLFFIKQFKKNNYCWWIIFSPILLGMTAFIVRKDFILYTLLIGCLYLLRNSSDSLLKRILACMLIVLGLFLHEAFIFFGFPIYAMVLLSFKNKRTINYALILIPILIFLILCKFKGNYETAVAIVNSWNNILPGTPLEYNYYNSIGAIGWESIPTFIFHIRTNANLIDGGIGIVMLPVSIIAIYYLVTNFLITFNQKNQVNSATVKQALSLLYSFAIICLIPMFTILSCDTGRVVQYSTVTTFATLLILSPQTVIKLFPKWYNKSITYINNKIYEFLRPSKGLLIIMLLFLGMAPDTFSLPRCWRYSIIGTLFENFISIILWLAHLFL